VKTSKPKKENRMLNAEIVNKDEEIIRFVDELLERAVREGVEKVHIEPQAASTRVRFRKDGKLFVAEGYENIPKQLHQYIIARIKTMSETMKLDVTQRPQDGKIIRNILGRNISLNLLSYPTIYGEGILFHRIDVFVENMTIEELFNHDAELIGNYRRVLNNREGLILFTGPVGSGKSTFINTTVKELADPGVKIVTVESPVELELNDTEQFKVDDLKNLSSYLRAACRCDVDILYISALIDFTTTHIALEMGIQPNVMVLSTKYANDAISTLFNFTEMGIKEYMTASGLQMVLALRLYPKLCPHCKEVADHSDTELKSLGLTNVGSENYKFHKSQGCDKCFGTGYFGKVAIVEMLELTKNIRDAFVKGADYAEIRKISREEGVYHSLEDDALKRFIEGDIDIKGVQWFVSYDIE
jgi:type II secretory ATPase GspE/PulE/Tfp pilus assembly ATPase PilB-like protein